MSQFKHTWNLFNELVDQIEKSQATSDEKKHINHAVRKLQDASQTNHDIGMSESNKVTEITRLRSNEKFLSDRIMGDEKYRRNTRNIIIMCLVVLNSIQLLWIINLLLDFVFVRRP